MKHRWSGWPGAWCLNCGCPDPLEEAMNCKNCSLPYGPEDPQQEIVLCSLHQHTECPGPLDGCNPYTKRGDNVE